MDNDALDDLVRRLTTLIVKIDERDTHMMAMLDEQRAMNQRLEGFIAEQRGFNARQLDINADIRTTLARLETIIARLGQQGENGRHA